MSHSYFHSEDISSKIRRADSIFHPYLCKKTEYAASRFLNLLFEYDNVLSHVGKK